MVSLTVDDHEAVTRLMRKMLADIDPQGTHLSATSAEEALEILELGNIQVLFLDIEIPNMSGVEMAQKLTKEYPKLNVIFVTGHPEYAYQALKVHCCGFITKPIEERDIMEELERLRPENRKLPVKFGREKLTVLCGEEFRINGSDPEEFFTRDRTHEMFAYLIYRGGAMCSNSEIITVMFGIQSEEKEKQNILRQYVSDMRAKLRELGAEDLIKKRYGKIGLDTERIQIEGETEGLRELFHWY